MSKFALLNVFYHVGKYFQLLLKSFRKPDKTKVFFDSLFFEIEKIGLNSIGIVFIISIFMGAVITIQTAINITIPLVPLYLVGLTARDSIILEFSSTIVALILAGKVGANIASELGTMRIQEQIEALDIMGVNSANYLIMPKILVAIIIFPLLTIFSVFIGIGGGYLASLLTGIVPTGDFLYGVHIYFKPFYLSYSLLKVTVFGFIITSVSAYHGYYVKGGALEVGKASTRAVVYSSILVLLFNVILTQMLLQ